MLSDDEQGYTYVARGDRIDVVNQQHPDTETETFSTTSTTALALDSAGGLIANDGLTILRFRKGETRAVELFNAEQSAPEGWRGMRVGNIVVARDGVIWVTAGSSVFRYQDGKLEEFNWFVDPTGFPPAVK